MKNILITFLLVAILAGSYVALRKEEGRVVPENTQAVQTIVRNLEIPWDIAFLPEGGMLITERSGRLLLVKEGSVEQEIQIQDVRHRGEGGLLGLVLHPNFENNRLLYLYLTSPVAGGGTTNRILRYVFKDNTLSNEFVVIDDIPGAIFHDGGRMAFGLDGKLYVTTGDATRADIAQDTSSLGGKVLRLEDDGSIPSDNPFGNEVYSYGHRNPQGLAWDDDGRLWLSEHGRSGIRSGLDEINLIEKAANYGWPESQGDEVQVGTVAPALHSGPDITWAPASLVYLGGSLYFGGLRGETLYEAVLEGDRILELKEHFVGEFGRLRTVVVGPDNHLYVTTSNTDGRGNPAVDDDRIIRIDPNQL